MSSAAPNSGDIFDVRKIRRLVELMNEHGLSEIDLRQAGMRVRLRRQLAITSLAPDPRVSFATAAGQPPPPDRVSQPAAPPPAAASDNLALIKSPMVGTFYSAGSPDAAPFVKVGDHVGPESTVCIIEAMKVFNEIQAELSGRIAAVLVENGEPVEFGQPLFKVEPL